MTTSSEKFDNCEVCAATKAKYTCPKCEVRTCSLTCVNIHKKELECNGIRDKIKFIPIDRFTDLDLLSDYRLLEDLGRSVENLQKDPLKKCTRENKQLPVHLQRLRKAAYCREINLEFMPQNFRRHKENTTYYKWNEDKLFWKVEFIFPQAENVKWIVDRVIEFKRLSELLDEIFNSDPNTDNSSSKLILQNKLRYYKSSGLSGLKVLLKAEKIIKSDSRFYELDLTQTIQENLKNKTIIEYPIIYVVLKDHSDMFEIVDSDDETESAVTSRKKINLHTSQNTVRKNEIHTEMKKQKTDSSLNFFFNGDISDYENDDEISNNYIEKKCKLNIPDYNELVKMKY